MIGVGAIYPGDTDKIYYFKQNLVSSQKQSLPIYFSLAIVGGDVGNGMLKNRISELIRVVELIEQKREIEENLKKICWLAKRFLRQCRVYMVIKAVGRTEYTDSF